MKPTIALTSLLAALTTLAGCAAPTINVVDASAEAWAPDLPPTDSAWHQLAMRPTLDLPARPGPQPETGDDMYQAQMTHTAAPEVDAALRGWLFTLPCIQPGPSTISESSAQGALFTDDCGEVEKVFPFGDELTHVHDDTGTGSLHILLPTADADEVLAEGWGEIHPWSGWMMAIRPLRMVLIYAPRDTADLTHVQAIIYRSYLWHTGQG